MESGYITPAEFTELMSEDRALSDAPKPIDGYDTVPRVSAVPTTEVSPAGLVEIPLGHIAFQGDFEPTNS